MAHPYTNLRLPHGTGTRPYVYLNMVASVDGKAVSANPKIHPGGGKADVAGLSLLRSYCDGLVNGRKTAAVWDREVSFNRSLQLSWRKRRGLPKYPHMFILTNSGRIPPSEKILRAKTVPPAVLVVPSSAKISPAVAAKTEILRVGKKELDLRNMIRKMAAQYGIRRLLTEGGPELNGAFVKEGIIDDLFLSIHPNVYAGPALRTIIEGAILPIKRIKEMKLIMHKHVGDELFLQYRFKSSPYA